jgi:hypothetical protein
LDAVRAAVKRSVGLLFDSYNNLEPMMKPLFVSIFFLCAFIGFAQTNQRSKTPVEILYGPREAGSSDKSRWPVISGVLNSKASLEALPAYTEKAKELRIEGRGGSAVAG